jgi:hypothetical protein
MGKAVACFLLQMVGRLKPRSTAQLDAHAAGGPQRSFFSKSTQEIIHAA